MDSYGEIVRRFQDMAYGYAYSVLGDFHQAEDAAQEAFIEAYRCLSNLREPAAFPGWFRRIVFKHCDRMTRGRQRPAVSVDAEGLAGAASAETQPVQAAQDREMKEKVLTAIRSLSEPERTVTTLFYINGYSQNQIAEFLEVPAGTVKSRLHSSRTRLKKRMLDMVEETLHDSAPDERFSEKVITELLSGPDLLQLENHPVSQMWRTIQDALGEYEVVKGEEIVDSNSIVNKWALQFAYQPSDKKVLRTETIVTLFDDMAGRTPPLQLMTAGRRFQSDPAVPDSQRVFHSFTVLCIESGVGRESMEATLQKFVEAAIGSVALRYEDKELYCLEYCGNALVDQTGESTGISLGCGILSAETLGQAGFDPSQVGGYVFCGDLEELAMFKLGIDDVRKLWQAPYMPE